jgi:hypothetical protein
MFPTLSSGTLNQGISAKRSEGVGRDRSSGLVGTVPSRVRGCSLVYRERSLSEAHLWQGSPTRCVCVWWRSCEEEGRGRRENDGRTLDVYWFLSSLGGSLVELGDLLLLLLLGLCLLGSVLIWQT